MSNTANQSDNIEQKNEVDMDRVRSVSKAMLCMTKAIENDIMSHNSMPSPNSKASNEIGQCSKVAITHGAGHLLMISAFEHVYALHILLRYPHLNYPDYTCARGVLEMCSLSSWIYDVDVGYKKRIARALNLLLKGSHNELKLSQNKERIGSELGIVFPLDETQNKHEEGIEYLKSLAKSLHIKEKYNKKGIFVGFGSGCRPISDLAHQYSFEGYFWYSFLSSVAHGNIGSMIYSGMQFDDSHPELKYTIITFSMTWVGQATWRWYELFGWDLNQLKKILESHYDQVGIPNEFRFWRKNNPA